MCHELQPDRENHDEARQTVRVELGLQTPQQPPDTILLIYNKQHICPRLFNRWITHTARFQPPSAPPGAEGKIPADDGFSSCS